MSGDGVDLDDLSPGEERLLALLMLLQEEAPRPGEALTDAILREARRQLVIRRALQTLGSLLGGIADGARLLFGLGPRPAPARAA